MSHLKQFKKTSTGDNRSNKKLCFYSIFKTDVLSKSHYLEQVVNLKHRRAVAKLRSGNHSLRIESGRHCVPKRIISYILHVTVYLSYLNILEFVNTAVLTKLRTKIISYFIVIVIKLLDNK